MPDQSKCDGCYRSDLNGTWWCDNCDQWPCICITVDHFIGDIDVDVKINEQEKQL